MNKIIIFALSLFLFSNSIYAQTPTGKSSIPSTTLGISPSVTLGISPSVTLGINPSATTTDVIDKLKQIKILKEKIATKVAELREKEKAAVFGIVKKIDKSSLLVETHTGDKTISFSDDTIYYLLDKGKKTQISRSKLSQNATISVFGYYNGDKTSLSSKYIYLQTPSVHLIGKIIDIDKENFTITVKEKQNQIIVDIENYTRTFIFSPAKFEFTRSGFSKLTLSDLVQIVGISSEKGEGRISANRIYAISGNAGVKTSPTKAKESSPSATPTKAVKIPSPTTSKTP